MATNLKQIAQKRILENVIRSSLKPTNGDCSYSSVLLVDKPSLHILVGSCDLFSTIFCEHFVLDELERERPPMRSLEAVYMITPCENSLMLLMNDFSSPGYPKYSTARVFFTYACPPYLQKLLQEHPVHRFIQTLKEINLCFIPYEPQVYTLDYCTTLGFPYDFENSESLHASGVERMATQIFTLCVTLEEYPNIRYRANGGLNAEIAELVCTKLENYKANNRTFGKGPGTQLLIIDRAIDCISPLLHDVTIQAMAYDLLPLRNDYDRFKANHVRLGRLKEDVFPEADNEIWLNVRHLPITEAIQQIATRGLFINSPKLQDINGLPMTEIWQKIRKLYEHRFGDLKPMDFRFSHYRVIDACVDSYNEKVKQLYKVEQELVNSTDIEGETFRHLMGKIDSILIDASLSDYDKIRIILLVVKVNKEVSEEYLNYLIQRAKLPADCKGIFRHMARLGSDLGFGNYHKKSHHVSRKDLDTVETPCWTPVLKDIAEDAVKGCLDQDQFPFLSSRFEVSSQGDELPKCEIQGELSKVIIFIVGGLTYSEMRTAYEVTAAAKNCEVLVGSTHFITPEGFLNDLKKHCEN